jgi:WD40 repeat protein
MSVELGGGQSRRRLPRPRSHARPALQSLASSQPRYRNQPHNPNISRCARACAPRVLSHSLSDRAHAGHENRIPAVCFSTQQHGLIASGDDDGRILVRSAVNGELIHIWKGRLFLLPRIPHPLPPFLEVCHNHSPSLTCTVVLRYTVMRLCHAGHTRYVYSLCFVGDTAVLASASKTVCLWHATKGTRIREFTGSRARCSMSAMLRRVYAYTCHFLTSVFLYTNISIPLC